MHAANRGDYLLCNANNMLLRAGSMAKARMTPVAIAHVGGTYPWLVYDPTTCDPTRTSLYYGAPVCAVIQPDGYLEVIT